MKQWLTALFAKIGSFFKNLRFWPFNSDGERPHWKWVALAIAVFLLGLWILSWYWGREPGKFDVRKNALEKAGGDETRLVTGFVTTACLIRIAETLLDKPGGYLSNDIMPPSVFMDNIPNWEFGVLVQIRDMTHSLRYDMSRSRSQSEEDTNLREAEPLFSYHNDSWAFPSSEGQYHKGIKGLKRYLEGLAQQKDAHTQFYARADNLRDWLAMVEKQLGSLSQRLSASIGQARVNTDLAGDDAARQSTSAPGLVVVKTPWLELDDVFYEARGATWALLHLLKAVEVDFEDVLQKKNARALVRQIIRELEMSQRRVWSPIILNGGGYGLFANHSLVIASYISRANASLLDLRNLLAQG